MAKYRTVSPGSYGLKEEIHYLYYASVLCCALHNFRVRLTPWQSMV